MSSLIARCFAIVGIVLIFGLSDCSAGNVNALPAGTPAGAAQRHTRPGRLVLHVVIPKKKRHHRNARFISPATQSITVSLSGPTPFTTTVALMPSSQGCSGSGAGTFCTVTIPGLAAGDYTGSMSTWDTPGGTGNELSANQSVSFHVKPGTANTIKITLGGIPTGVAILPDADSSWTGNTSAGFSAGKCGGTLPKADRVSVFGVDADDNLILGAGAPVPTLASGNTAIVAVATPSPSSPNAFVLSHPLSSTAQGPVTLTATVTPPTDSGASAQQQAVSVTISGGTNICGFITEFSTNFSGPFGITAGPDGNLWFTESTGNRIAKITTSGTLTEYSTSGNAVPRGITAGPDGKLWFAEGDRNSIATSTTSGSITEYSASSSSNVFPDAITVGPDGNLWFTEFLGNSIGKMDTSGTLLAEYSAGLSAGAGAAGIAAGPDGNLWFTESNTSTIGKITTNGTITEYSAGITPNAAPTGIVAGPDGNLWFTECSGNRIGKITTSGTVTEYSVGITANSGLTGIAAGPDGNLWFTETGVDHIGKITTSGTVTEYSGITHGGLPAGIAVGSDGSLWFTECVNAIGRLQ